MATLDTLAAMTDLRGAIQFLMGVVTMQLSNGDSRRYYLRQERQEQLLKKTRHTSAWVMSAKVVARFA